MQHNEDSKGFCYINTKSEVLRIRPCWTEQNELTIDKLREAYGDQLNHIKSVIMTFTHWLRNDLLEQIHSLPGLSLVQIILEEADTWRDVSQAEDETLELLVKEKERELIFQIVGEGYEVLNEIKTGDKDFLGTEEEVEMIYLNKILIL
ncbi:hypothetical protein NM208_g4227 [Fusarium decemcellulare]|uniref:Uncharacterized protein n=1 Tax=Fusarium decemcellulare TaxID=57161 RepID=A0ACC1SLH5_9HYPO|nr:hypothetical protein NM208_g4227 [Fusarium decemcellulare]